jgi:hypothetical protein
LTCDCYSGWVPRRKNKTSPENRIDAKISFGRNPKFGIPLAERMSTWQLWDSSYPDFLATISP